MNKKSIYIILFIMLLAVVILSLYTTFAYDEEASKIDESTADYNLIYGLKETSNRQVTIAAQETKHIDIILSNTYNATIKYGMYYHLIKPNNMPNNVKISIAEESINQLQGTIKPNDTATISIMISNQSEYNLELIIGALVGFENGNIEELLGDNEVLIK